MGPALVAGPIRVVRGRALLYPAATKVGDVASYDPAID
jgi:hypothetical protein